MEANSVGKQMSGAGRALVKLTAGALLAGVFGAAGAVTVYIKDPKTKLPPTGTFGFQYTIEEDNTYDVKPDDTGLHGDPTLSLGFHRSHMKIVKIGHVSGATQFSWTPADPDKKYFVTVLPDNASFQTSATGYTMNGVTIPAGASEVTVPVNQLPIKTSQISVFVFEDNGPINGAADNPGEQEKALCGWELQLFEAGGTYGASGGRVSYDTFGNPLGTEYNGVEPDGTPIVSKYGSGLVHTDRNGVARIKNLSPAKYTIFSIAPHEKPSLSRCSVPDANGAPTNNPIWVSTPGDLSADADVRAQQMVWNLATGADGQPYELPPDQLDADNTKWHQTTTIEGTWGVDAWVKAGEPTFFKEFGPPGHHVWHGFVRRFKDRSADGTGLLAAGGSSVEGIVKSTHMSRPPGIRFYSGAPMASCWIGLNSSDAAVGLGKALYANACDAGPSGQTPGHFKITGLVPGKRYQLSVWDEPLDNVIANYEFTAPVAGENLDLHDVPVFSWFSNLQGKVFYDTDGTGFPFTADGTPKPGIPNAALNIRFRDGSIYNSTVTDDAGEYEFAEVFPFFNWMVAETDFTNLKATGATVIPDNGGEVVDPAGDATEPEGLWPAGTMTPQVDPDTGKRYRIFGGDGSPSSSLLLQAFQGFLGQTNVIHWGKREYDPGNAKDHGGITGIVHYASTRAENDPMFATAENNEPGVPSVKIRLYKLNNDNLVVRPGGGTVDPEHATEADAVQIVHTDDWNQAEPDQCVDPAPYVDGATNTNFGRKCYDGMRVWNQVRDGVFDGGFGFTDYCAGGVTLNATSGEYECVGGVDPVPLEPGRYMTEAVAPYGYEHQKEEDKNVDFGDLLVPGSLANPVACIGSRREARDGEGGATIPELVPAYLTMFPDVEIPERFRDAPGKPRPYCNKKLVVLAPGMNPFSDFNIFAKAPVAGHIVGMILDDLANEFDPYSPSFGEKYAPPFMPISIRDQWGNEINRVYSDRYGTYNALVPSTFAYNVPLPSGVAPNMVNVCLNSPTMPDGTIDPHYNPQYTQYCYTFQYLPGKTTYLDTPVLPIAAFAGPTQYALDADLPDGTPRIKMMTSNALVGGKQAGPWVPANVSGRTLTLTSMGQTMVSNPVYAQNNGETAPLQPKTIARDYGFGGTAGRVYLIRANGSTFDLGISNWTAGTITATLPNGTAWSASDRSGTIVVVRGDNQRKSVGGATLHIGTEFMPNGHTAPIMVGHGSGYAYESIQAAIDAPTTADGDLIVVAPGVYEEAPIVWKRVRVQGWGAPSTIVNASMGADYLRQQAWREKVCDLVMNQGMDTALLTGQTLPADMNACLTGDTVDNAPLLFATEEASGFFVLEKPVPPANVAIAPFKADGPRALRIDGFTITGADTGGGVVVNGNAAQMAISNNIVIGNQGLYNGGIRIGHADLLDADLPVDSNNPLVVINHNLVLKNGNTAGEVAGGGGGISIYTGSAGYQVDHNYVAGNFSTGDGGGLNHYGHSGKVVVANVADNSTLAIRDNRTASDGTYTYTNRIENNQFRFNQSFNQAKSVQGGGIAVTGIIDPGPDNGVSLGTGDLDILNNVIQGNLAGAGDGGGIALIGVNGTADVTEATTNRGDWYRVGIYGNVITNNGAGMAGGGVSLQDAANVNIYNNTIAMNESYATAARAFPLGITNAANQLAIAASTLQPGAGIAAYGHSAGLRAQIVAALAGDVNTNGVPYTFFSDARIQNSVVLGNRSRNWAIDYNVDPTTSGCTYLTNGGNACFGLSAPTTSDIAVIAPDAVDGSPNRAVLQPTYSVFSALSAGDGTADPTNTVGDITAPGTSFSSAYYTATNGALKTLIYALEQSVVLGAPVLEVLEPATQTTPATAAAFDEGGNFIDVRFGPLTRGACTGGAGVCPSTWRDFGSYNPSTSALTNEFGGGVQVGPNMLSTDLNGATRSTSNWIRGALVTGGYQFPQP